MLIKFWFLWIFLYIESNRLCSTFLQIFLHKNSTVSLVFFSWLHSAFQITTRVSFCIFYLDTHKINPCRTPITTSVINIDRHSFNFDQIFFVFLVIRTICTSKLNYFVMYIMRKFFQESLVPNIHPSKVLQHSTSDSIRRWLF